MPILNVQLVQVGEVGIQPQVAYVLTNDTLALVTAAGYLNKYQQNNPGVLNDTTMCLVTTKTSEGAVSTQLGWFEVSYNTATKDWSLLSGAAPGSVTLPTVANHLAVFTNTTGNLADNVATAIQGGNLQAGLSGTAGYLASFPATAAKGSFRVVAVANTGDTLVTLSNALHGQATVYSIPDVGAATGQMLVKTAALVSGNLIQASGTGGIAVDSGVATTNVQLKTQVKAATTANIGGAGAGPIVVSVTGATSASVVVATIATSSNAVSVVKAVAGSGNFSVTFSGDPGATCTLNYVVYIAGQ